MLQITISRRSALLIAIAIVMAIPTAAFAGSLFSDVEDGSTHIDGITFMKDSGVTLGCGDGTTFCPDDPVLREQMATFMYRLSGNDPDTAPSVWARREYDIAFSIGGGGSTTGAGWNDVLDADGTVTIPEGQQGVILASFGAESACQDTNTSCHVRILVNGSEMNPSDGIDTAFDSPDNTDTEPWESHFIQRSSNVLPAGTYTVKVQANAAADGATLWLDDWHFFVEVLPAP